MRTLLFILSSACFFNALFCSSDAAARDACSVSLHVLGVAQDGGKPQIGNPDDPAWTDPALRRHATSLAIVDRRHERSRRWLFEATPDVKDQLQKLDQIAPSPGVPLDGVFLTHAHIGHYAGLMFFGHESMGAREIPVYTMPRMAEFLRENGPWSQLVKYKNIVITELRETGSVNLAQDVKVTPFLVPHRQEFSEVVGYEIRVAANTVLFIPDIDSWEEWDALGVRIEDRIADVDIVYLDATFFANGEIPGRDMTGFPHPFVSHSMARFAALPADEKAKVQFIHMNHTNPLLDPDAPERTVVAENGFDIAEEGDAICLAQ